VLEEPSPEERAERHTDSHDSGDHADRASALGGGEHRGDDRQAQREDGGSARTHGNPRRDELSGRAGPRPRGRGDAEHEQSAGEDGTPADTIAEHAAGDEEGDVEDGAVETDDEKGHAQSGQNPPATWVGRGGGRSRHLRGGGLTAHDIS
jgi:hypothetical protein